MKNIPKTPQEYSIFSKKLQIVVIVAFLVFSLFATIKCYTHVDLVHVDPEIEVDARVREATEWDGPTDGSGNPMN